MHAVCLLRFQVLSNTIKQKRKEKAGKWDVPLPKVSHVLVGYKDLQRPLRYNLLAYAPFLHSCAEPYVFWSDILKGLSAPLRVVYGCGMKATQCQFCNSNCVKKCTFQFRLKPVCIGLLRVPQRISPTEYRYSCSVHGHCLVSRCHKRNVLHACVLLPSAGAACGGG